MVYELISFRWPAYFETVGVLVILYWLSIGLLYYRKEISGWLQGNRTPGNPINIDNPFEAPAQGSRQASLFREEPDAGREIDPEELEDGLFPLVCELADELRVYIQDAGRRRMVREELMQGLQLLVRKEPYQPIRATGFRTAINNLVAVEAEEHCGVHYSAEELKMLWVNERS